MPHTKRSRPSTPAARRSSASTSTPPTTRRRFPCSSSTRAPKHARPHGWRASARRATPMPGARRSTRWPQPRPATRTWCRRSSPPSKPGRRWAKSPTRCAACSESTVNSWSEDALLAIDGLTVEFPSRSGALRAVDDVSLSIAAGETLGLVGESGSGKSMTALAAVGLVPPPGRVTSGTVRFEGQSITGMGERDLRRVRGAGIGFVFQEPMTARNPVFTIGAQLVETLEVHGIARGREARARAISLFDAVRLPDPARRFDDYPHQLSGGQRQRALIAMALACGPALLIAD